MATKGKRIQSVTIKKIFDQDGDTSWLGEYSNRKSSDLFSIDRAHTEDCNVNSLEAKQAIDTLERIIAYLNYSGEELVGEAFDDALTLLGDAQDELRECDCSRGRWTRNEYQYFNPSFNYVDAHGDALKDHAPEEVREYVAQDYKRMEDLNNGYWYFVGIRAEAQIIVNDVIQEITSPGLWGNESDSGEEHFKQVEQEELGTLRDQLEALGFSKRAIATAFKDIEHEEEN